MKALEGKKSRPKQRYTHESSPTFAFSLAWMTPKKRCVQHCARSCLWTMKRTQQLGLTWPCCCRESCRTQWSVGEQHRADSKLGVQSRIVPITEYAAMREAIEAVHGSLRDKELPSKSLLARKLEQVEDNAPHVEDLRDVTSLEDSQIGSYETVIDPASTFLSIKPGKTMTTLLPIRSFACGIVASV